jgi:hypothetical protein
VYPGRIESAKRMWCWRRNVKGAMEPVVRHEVVSDNVPGLGKYCNQYSSHK